MEPELRAIDQQRCDIRHLFEGTSDPCVPALAFQGLQTELCGEAVAKSTLRDFFPLEIAKLPSRTGRLDSSRATKPPDYELSTASAEGINGHRAPFMELRLSNTINS